MSDTKPFDISKQMVYEAYLRVKANRGAAGVDGETIEDFEKKLKSNLYKIWNRMSSGTYFPPPVKYVEIPKNDGKNGVRKLGLPTVSDRIAQTVVKLYLEPLAEPEFHPDSYGYRPNKSALDAVTKTRERCWKYFWVVDLDLRAFFDMLDHELVLTMVKKHTDCKWILLYIERWLKAPVQLKEGILQERHRGSPQGSVVSPLISNIVMHHVFDKWMEEKFPHIPFARYADDGVAHCVTEKQSRYIKAEIARRLEEHSLELHPEKTHIVYCKNSCRKGTYEFQSFDFLGYTFRPRLAKSGNGRHFVGFLPAVSNKALKAIRSEIRSWRIHTRSDKSIEEIALMVNAKVQGWINYYGRFYPSWLKTQALHRLNEELVLWVRRKYKQVRRRATQARQLLVRIAKRQPDLFAHWRYGVRPDGWTMGAG